MNDFILDTLLDKLLNILCLNYFDGEFASIGLKPKAGYCCKTNELEKEFIKKYKISANGQYDLEELISSEINFQGDKAFKDGLKLGALIAKVI